MRMRLEDLREEEEEVEVICPLDDREAQVRILTFDGGYERATVAWCSRFGEQSVTCGQPCMGR